MSESVALCTHIKTDGVKCGSPAMSGSEVCFHHSAVKTALGKALPPNEFGVCPIPFVFPEDRASMQINFFLLLQAFNEGRIDLRTYNSMLGMLRSMAKNLGKSGSLVEDREQGSEQGSELRAQEGRDEVTREKAAGEEESDPMSEKRELSAGSGQGVGHPRSSVRDHGEAAA